MSLDVYLELDDPIEAESGSGIFIREDGRNKEISRAEWDERFPDREPLVALSETESTTAYTANITHNLNKMAEEAGIYEYLWRPEEIGIESAGQLVDPLTAGLKDLIERPEYYQQFSPDNGWGDYNGLVRFVTNYLEACKEYPQAKVSVSR